VAFGHSSGFFNILYLQLFYKYIIYDGFIFYYSPVKYEYFYELPSVALRNIKEILQTPYGRSPDFSILQNGRNGKGCNIIKKMHFDIEKSGKRP